MYLWVSYAGTRRYIGNTTIVFVQWFVFFFPFSKDLSDLFLILYIHLCSVHACMRACQCSKSPRGSFGGAVHASTAEPSH